MLSAKPAPATSKLEPHRRTAERLGISTKTCDRWTAAGILEPPVKINGRKFHRTDSKPRPDHKPE